MKYMFLSIAALAVVFGLSFLIAGLIRRKLKKKPRMAVHVIICVLISFAVMLAGGFIACRRIYVPKHPLFCRGKGG